MSADFDHKAKSARRVIEVLEYFDEHNCSATVMDFVRRYNRPQSSTSELLSSLVELGLLYKDARSRAYSLTPRAAILGSVAQPDMVRDGTLAMMVERLVAQTGLAVAVFGMVGLSAQIFRWAAGSKYQPTNPGNLVGGAQEFLCDTAAGLLLLSTVEPERRHGMLRRLNAEAQDDRKFSVTEKRQQVCEIEKQGYAVGATGFGGESCLTAALVPSRSNQRPLAIGFIYEPNDRVDPINLAALLQNWLDRYCTHRDGGDERVVLNLAWA